MRFSTRAIVLSTRAIGENRSLINCITPDKGLMKGFVSINRKNKSCNTVGHLISINYYGKENSVGKIIPEIEKQYTNSSINDKKKLITIVGMCEFVEFLFDNAEDPSNETQDIFNIMLDFFEQISKNKFDIEKLAKLVIILKKTITYAGYGFQLDKCVSNGEVDITKLLYLSPKSASAVSEIAGKPYEHKLLKLPKFFITEKTQDIVSEECINSGLTIINHFFEKIAKIINRKPPISWYKTKEILLKK